MKRIPKHTHVIIPTSAARHFFPSDNAPMQLPDKARVIIPTPNKEASYRFPDGEVYLRVSGLKHASKITIVHCGYPDPNGGLMELFMLLNIVRLYSHARWIEVIFTAIPYGRQDKAYYEGELNMAETLINTLNKQYRVARITTLDAHFANERWVRKLTGVDIVNVSMARLLMAVAKTDHPEIVFMTPDAGSTRRTHIKEGAKKQRENSFSVKVAMGDLSGRINGKIIGVVDDILSTGTTLEKFRQETKRFGAKKVFALITHGVNPSGIQRIRAVYDGLYLTNTINRPGEANVSVDNELWKIIMRSVNEK